MVNQVEVVADTTHHDRLKQTLLLIVAIWLVGLTGHFTLLKEWGALALYLIGSITLALWRGLLLSSLIGSGFSSPAAIGLTTLCFMLNHFAVAPVGLLERGMMALMGLPLGIINGFLTIKTQNLWGGALIHLLTMLAMVLGIFLM
jgi:membrane protease YdiL (CAAX protease family)